MTGQTCTRCGSAATLFLCNNCLKELRGILIELPWLLDQLDTTIQRQDKLSTGAIGHSSDNPSPINFGAMETAREARKTLLHIITEITKHQLGRIPPLTTVTTSDLARWLAHNINHIAKHPDANEYFTDIAELTEEDERGRPGKLCAAINRTDRRFAGPCPTLKGHNERGERIECGVFLYAALEEKFTRCPACDAEVDVKQNRLKAAADRDTVTEKQLLEILANEAKYDGWPIVSRVKLYEWIRAHRLTPKGWLHEGQPVKYYIRRGDPRLFSLTQARENRWRDLQAKEKAANA